MAQITRDAFLARLNTENRGFLELAEFMQLQEFFIEPKHVGMLETAKRLSGQGWSPVVDKRFGLIFGCPDGFHEKFRGYLYCYHEERIGYEIGIYTGAERYVKDGLGYYISSMGDGVIIVGATYRIDNFDQELFDNFRTFAQ